MDFEIDKSLHFQTQIQTLINTLLVAIARPPTPLLNQQYSRKTFKQVSEHM